MAKKFDFKVQDTIIQAHPGLVRTASDIRTPETLDFRDLVLMTEDQGTTPQCAAYTGTSWLESIDWRRTGVPANLDPEALYKVAKTIDGYPEEQGTTLEAIMKGMIQLGWTDKTEADIRFVDTIRDLKRAIHRYNTLLIACNIHEQWNLQFTPVMDKVIGKELGGHAITCCGYDREGVFIQNSWGVLWGNMGYCKIRWSVFEKEFREGAYYANALNNLED